MIGTLAVDLCQATPLSVSIMFATMPRYANVAQEVLSAIGFEATSVGSNVLLDLRPSYQCDILCNKN